jgi:hypothetical protein
MYNKRREKKMNTTRILKAVVLLAALTIAGICLIVFAPAVQSPEARQVFPLVGTALFSSGLTYFLVDTTRLADGTANSKFHIHS